MEILKKIFPLSFKMMGNIYDFVIGILIYVAAALVGGIVIGTFATIGGALGVIFGILGGLIDLYALGGIAIRCLAKFGIIR